LGGTVDKFIGDAMVIFFSATCKIGGARGRTAMRQDGYGDAAAHGQFCRRFA
jgi:class 3 adenylate cyclase